MKPIISIISEINKRISYLLVERPLRSRVGIETAFDKSGCEVPMVNIPLKIVIIVIIISLFNVGTTIVISHVKY